MFNEKIPEQCTTVSRRDMHDSRVFPLLIEDNIACALLTLEYLIPLWLPPTPNGCLFAIATTLRQPSGSRWQKIPVVTFYKFV